MLDSLDTLIAFVLIMLVVSLLITIVVQMATVLCNLRGVNLAQGLRRTFGVIDSKSDKHAKQLANYILKGRFLSDSFLPDWPILRWWRHAEAVRPREVFDAIQRIALGKESGDYISQWCNKPVVNLKDKACRILKGLGLDEATITNAEKAINQGQECTKEFTEAAKANYHKFEYWTCTCEQRAQQWLTMHTRILTIIFAVIAAFWLQLDTVEIFKAVSSNKAMRDKLVMQAAAVSSQADKAFRDSKSVLQKTYEGWLDQSDPRVKAAISSNPITVEPNDTREKLTGRIEASLTSASVADKEAPLESFNKMLDETALGTLKEKAGDYAAVKADFDNTGFELFPKSDKGRWEKGWRHDCTKHIWGILFSAGFLSLGAPFWYNALKNFVNLRSQVAQNISSEEKQKPPDTSAPPAPTPIPPELPPDSC